MDWTRGCTIGRGSTATVSIGEARGSGEVFAVKSAELDRAEFLKREQRILATLKCPQIVEYKGCDVTFEDGRVLYNLFMEYAPYGSIADEIGKKNGDGLDEGVVGAYAREILLGLIYLHSNGTVHCDIKCQNVLLTDEGAKIADLGCARRVAAEMEDSCGVIAGTPAFMAPEVARGEKQGFPADVWALGCTVLEMITGQPPWQGVSDPVSVIYRVGFAGEVPEIPSFMSEQGKDFVTKCLKTDPNERGSVSELLKHEFVQESKSKGFDNSTSDSPTTVLDRGCWDSWEERRTTRNANPDLDPNPAHDCSWNLPSTRSRIRRLSSSMPNWESDEMWITVRGNGIIESERFSDGQESKAEEANEKTETSGSDSDGFIREDNALEITVESRTLSTVGLSNCCNVNDVYCFFCNHSCCKKESLLGCSQCIKIEPRGKFDSSKKEIVFFCMMPSDSNSTLDAYMLISVIMIIKQTQPCNTST